MKRFKKIYIEITNICNLNCEFCPVTKRKPEFMDSASFEKILQQIKPFTDYIYFHVKGEPLLHPLISDFLHLSEKYGFTVNLTTNGTLISEVKNNILGKTSLRQVNFSLHSYDANENTDNITSYLYNILQFTKTAIDQNIIVSYRLWNLEEDNKSIEKNRHILKTIEDFFNLPYRIEDRILDIRGLKLMKNVYLNLASRFEWPDSDQVQSDSTGFCYGLRDQAAILVDGTVVPCCLDGEGVINLGNINTSDFADIINSHRAVALYDGFSNRKVAEELCRKCDYRRRFNS